MADMQFAEGDYESTRLYIDRYHLVARPSAKSLWLAIQNTLELDSAGDVDELAQRLESEFPDSREYQDWLKIQ